MNLFIIGIALQENRQSGRSLNILRYSTIDNGGRKDLGIYILLLMADNSMQEGKRHEYLFVSAINIGGHYEQYN
jgi:hypothetical protein